MMVVTSFVLLACLTTGQKAPAFPEGVVDLSGGLTLEGENYQIPIAKSKISVLIFLDTQCPVANRYAPEIKRINQEFTSKGVAMYRVYLTGSDNKDEVIAHGKDFGYECPVILDPQHKLVKSLGISVTPEVAVIGQGGKLLYRGRIDSQTIDHGKIAPDYRKDLRIALGEILAGQPVTQRMTAPIGCFIPPPG